MKHSPYLLILILAALLLPNAAKAQILPGCDRTIYVVPQGGWIQKVKPTVSLGFVGPLPEFVNQHVITPELYYKDPTKFNPGVSAAEATKNVTVGTNRECGFNDFVQLFVNIINWGFSMLAIVSLFFIIWGGFTMLISGGRSEMIETGKKTIQGTIVGVVVVLTAYIIVNFYVTGLIGKSTASFLGTKVPNPLGGTSCQQEFKKNNVTASECSSTNLVFGCTDSESANTVKDIQRALNKKCGSCGPVNGCYGNETAHCVRMFQAANNMDVTGEIDISTASAINGGSTLCYRSIPYHNPIGYPDFENVFPDYAMPGQLFGSCNSPTWSCIPAHSPAECPDEVVGGIRRTYTYSASPCT